MGWILYAFSVFLFMTASALMGSFIGAIVIGGIGFLVAAIVIGFDQI